MLNIGHSGNLENRIRHWNNGHLHGHHQAGLREQSNRALFEATTGARTGRCTHRQHQHQQLDVKAVAHDRCHLGPASQRKSREIGMRVQPLDFDCHALASGSKDGLGHRAVRASAQFVLGCHEILETQPKSVEADNLAGRRAVHFIEGV